ncbi:hypothetical protein BWD42_04790 [Sphingobacterium sp. CZ-UAM]|nr:hypothetical protein BWD42_04790 [Sphingobacterium sp. CZ-UAM]
MTLQQIIKRRVKMSKTHQQQINSVFFQCKSDPSPDLIRRRPVNIPSIGRGIFSDKFAPNSSAVSGLKNKKIINVKKTLKNNSLMYIFGIPVD